MLSGTNDSGINKGEESNVSQFSQIQLIVRGLCALLGYIGKSEIQLTKKQVSLKPHQLTLLYE